MVIRLSQDAREQETNPIVPQNHQFEGLEKSDKPPELFFIFFVTHEGF